MLAVEKKVLGDSTKNRAELVDMNLAFAKASLATMLGVWTGFED